MKHKITNVKGLMILLCAIFISANSFGQLRISQVYGGGGNTSATYNKDFVEIFNPTASPVTVTNWAIQQASAAGSTWAVQAFSATIPAGKYFLISLATGATGANLPTPDLVGSTSINIAAGSGKIFLTNSTTILVGTCPSSVAIVDYIGFGGTANCFETAVASGPANNTTSLLRANGGCTDVNNNSTDFSIGAVNPRNSASSVNSCTTPPTAITNPATVTSGTAATLNGTVNANGTSTGITFQYGLTISYGSTASGTPSPLTTSVATAVTGSVTGLTVNTQYNYRVVATAGTTVNGSNVTFYTFANVPNAPTVANPTTSSLDVTVGSGDGNPASTEYAIQETGSSNYVQAGGALGASAVWQTGSAWGTKTVTGLSSNTSYTFKLKARNGAFVETAFGSTTSGTTTSSGTPTILITGAITPFTTVAGTPSASQNYLVSGSLLTNDIIITPTANFEVSLDNSTWVNSSSFITLPQSGGVVGSTTIFVHFVSASAGTFTGSIGHTTIGGATQTISLSGTAYSLEPSIASNVTFGTTSATAMTINFSGGNGSSRIVVLKAGSAVGFIPTDGNAVTGVNADFSIAANQGSGDRIVYDGTGNTVSVTGLSSNTTYHVAVYEYNGAAPTINYFATPGIGNNTTLVAEPTIASALTFGAISTNSMVLNFTGGNGTSRIIVAHDNTTVTFAPVDLTAYSGVNSDFTLASDQGSGNKIVYDGSGTTTTVTGLSQNVVYFYIVYEYNGSGITSNYLLSPNGSNSATTVGPWPYGITGSTYSQAFNGLPATGTFAISGNPSYISTTPVNATGMGGWQIGATASTPKFFVGDGSTTTAGNYSLGTGTATERALGAIASGTTVSNLGIVLKNTTTDVLTTVTITFTGEQWRRGSGAANVLAFKYSVGGSDLLTGTFTSEPLLNFTSPVTTGLDVALNGNVAPNRTAVSATFTLNANWIPGQTLVLRWDDANDAGNDDMLGIDDFTFVATGPTTPTTQDNNISFSSILTTSLTASWINGDGANHLVLINTSNSFTNPLDGSSHTANTVFANAGEQVVYDGTGSSVNISGLTANTQYFVRVYGYNGSGAGSKYLTSTATLNPNNTFTALPSSATQVVVLNVNGGINPTVNQPFTVTVQAQDGVGSPQTVSANTTIQLSVWSGIGNLSGTISGVILAGTSTITISGLIYDAADFGVQLDANEIAGDPLTNNQSAFFDVLDVASNLAFSTTPSNGIANVVLSNIVVQARRPDATVDPSYTGAITLAVASGPGTISGTLTVNAINGVATFTTISLSTPGTYTLNANSGTLTMGTSPSILITATPALSELVIPKYIGCKTTSTTNNDRTPIAMCIQIDNLIPNTAYDLRAGIDTTTAPATSYGGGNIWTGTAFTGSTLTNAFTTNALGSSGPVWFFAQAATSRFEPGIQHNIRIGYAVTGSGLPTAPNFIGSKLITALDIPSTARTTATTDDGAFLKGTASTCLSGKYVLVYDNTAGTGDPLYAYQIRTAIPTAGSVSGLPTNVGEVFAQNGASVIGDYAAVVPIGANNPNGVRRIEARSSSNAIISFQTDADGIWPSGANTTTLTRRSVAVLTLSDAPLNTLSVSTSTTPATCVGTNDGTATANATGTGTLTYSWNTSPVQTTATITGLSSGTYIVTVTDGSGCSATASAVVGQPAASTITAGGPTTFCIPGSVTLSAGAGVGYTYLWSNGATTQSIVVTTTGNYSVTVDNGAGCVQTSLATSVTANSFIFTGTLYSENMGTPTGTTALVSNVFQNTSPITYTSTSTSPTDVRITNASTGSGGGNVFFGSSTTTPTRNFIISGINTQGASGLVLTFLIKRDNTSTDIMTLESSIDGINWSPLSFTTPSVLTWTSITINSGIPAAANLRLRFSKTSTTTAFRLDDVVITGSANSVIASATGSTTLCPGASVILSSNIPSSNTWAPGGATTRSITVNTAGSYTVTATGTNGCTATSAPIVFQTVTAPIVSVTPTNVLCNGGTNGSASTNVTSGTSPFTYLWSTTPIQTTSAASSLSAGNYSVVVTDVNGCSGSQSTTITQPTVLIASSAATTISCNGGTSTVTVSATGGTSPYTGTGTFTGVFAGTYSYVVTDANGCTANTSVTITQPTVLIASSSATTISCNGGTSTVTVSATGGTSPYTGTGTFTGVFAGTSSYVVTDVNGCTANTSVTITQPSPVVVTISITTTPCVGGTGTVLVSATGGTGAYTGTGTFTVSAGTVSYTVTDANGCTGSASTTIVANANPTASVTPTSLALCSDGSNSPTNLVVTTSETTIVWNDPATTTGNTLAVSYLGGAFTYTATVTNSFGCTTSVSVPVTIITCANGITLTDTVFIEGYSVGSLGYGSTGGNMDNGGLGGLMYALGISPNTTDVDTMSVSLVHPTTFAVVATATGILQTNGTLVTSFPSATAGYYYIKLNHRNAIETWSADSVYLGGTASYDFSSAANKAYGNNMIEVSPGVWAILSGDIADANFGLDFQDGVVESTDYSEMENAVYSILSGYVVQDITGDGVVESTDYSVMENNVFSIISSFHP